VRFLAEWQSLDSFSPHHSEAEKHPLALLTIHADEPSGLRSPVATLLLPFFHPVIHQSTASRGIRSIVCEVILKAEDKHPNGGSIQFNGVIQSI
jgi:hypothetical protein